MRTVVIASLLLLFPLVIVSADEAEPQSNSATISFKNQIEPIFSRHCYGCHQGAKQLGSYMMTDFSALLVGGESESPAIVPGKPDESYLVEQITPVDGHAEMPDEPFPSLSKVEVELVRNWIAQGAKNDAEEQGNKYDSEHPPVYVGSPAIPSIDVSPDGKLLAVAGFHEVIVLNANSGEPLQRLVGLSPRLNSVRFSPDNARILAVGGTPGVRGEVQIWQVETGDLLLSRLITYDALCGGSWSPDGSKIAFGATDNVVRALDSTTGEQVLFQGAHEDWVRDTAFMADGSHLVSIARDMSCKLTEVATERFVDNVTSITPGALSGGLSSIVAHPERNEIFLGGSDGIPKVYRVFRETPRKIGDDANLVRSFPKMNGRIFSVAISADGSLLAAASTLNGKSEIRAWKYDFDGTLSDELKRIMSKVAGSRNADEKKKVNDYQNAPVTEVFHYELPTTKVYSISFAADGGLVVAGTDGQIRRLDRSGKMIAEFAAVEIAEPNQVAGSFDARAWNQEVTKRTESTHVETPPVTDQVSELLVEPKSADFSSPYDYAQLAVTAVLKDGSTIDVTRLAKIKVPDWLTITSTGLVRPADNGSGTITISLDQQSVAINATAKQVVPDEQNQASHGAVDYIRDVTPILSRLGCNQGTCHGAQKGKAGFRLSLRGYDAVFDLRALTDDLAARRINPAVPEESLMLRKPLGSTPHQGGTLMTPGDPNHTILRRWIADGSKLNMDSARVTHIEVSPMNPIVQSTDARQQVRIVAHYSDGGKRDVTREAFIESGNTEVATADKTGLLSAVRRGEAPILARYEGAYAATTLTVMGNRKNYREPETEAWSRVDELVAEKWRRVKVVPSDVCDDATFLRRVFLDLTGLPPSSDEVRDFIDDQTPTRLKRSKVVDQLIGSEAYVEYWTNKWADLLQVNRKFLGVEGSTKFREWIRQAVAENRAYDQFAREVLTATGSNNENPPASYYKVLRTPEDTMENTTHLFLGIRFNCNKCHDHPFERWTQDQYYQMSAFFAQVGLEADPASGKRKIGGTAVEGAKPLFEKVVDKKSGDVTHPKTNQPVPPEFPFEVDHEVTQSAEKTATRREQLASWITDADNPYFARSYVNRLWGYLFGIGLIEPIDDIRAGNPATNPELLNHLTDSFVASGFDVQQMLRAICNSRTYQLDVATNPLNEDDGLNYSHALPRRLPAEVIYDAVHKVTGAVSAIPGAPKGIRAAALSDSGIKLADGFLQNLGRPARESACECERSTGLQLGPVMALISGPTIGTAISDPTNELERIVRDFPRDEDLAEEVFLRSLGRKPNEAELAAFAEMKTMIAENHVEITEQLAKAEEVWKSRRIELESQREKDLAETVAKIAARTEEIKPERAKLEKARLERIKAAEAVLADANAKLETQVDEFAKRSKSNVEWFPLSVSKATATNKAQLTTLPDRSVIASGNKAKGVYTLTMNTSLNNITGLRLEALVDSGLPNNGPGSADNGNFVVTEFEVLAAPTTDLKQQVKVNIASGVADFLQGGFKIEQTFNGQVRGQQGWAVHGATGLNHWATYKLKKPVQNEGGTTFTIKIHQFHNAESHTLGRFRISATTAVGDIPLGVCEPLAAALTTPKAKRSDAEKKLLSDYVAATDDGIRKATADLATAKAAVPPDAMLVGLEKQKERLSKPTADDPALVELRQDAQQSAKQLANIRLTATEDLTWALINSPAFLFNH